MTTTTTTPCQVYCIRDGRWELDGCWGSEYALCKDAEEAAQCCLHLASCYPDAGWGYEDQDGNRTVVCEQPDVDEDEAERIALAHIDSPEVRAWREEHPDATAAEIMEADWYDADLSGVCSDPERAAEAVIAAGIRVLDEAVRGGRA